LAREVLAFRRGRNLAKSPAAKAKDSDLLRGFDLVQGIFGKETPQSSVNSAPFAALAYSASLVSGGGTGSND
jgi:hypothetical protein